jgi:hypothetical protein
MKGIKQRSLMMKKSTVKKGRLESLLVDNKEEENRKEYHI